MSEEELTRIFLDTALRIEAKFDATAARLETGFLALREDFARLELKVDQLEQRVSALEVKVERLEQRVAALEVKVERLEQRVTSLELRVDRLEKKVDDLERKVNDLDAKVQQLDAKVDASSAENRHHFALVLEQFKANNIDFLAEGVRHLDQKIDRRTDELERQMIAGFAETHALIRYTYGNLDARM